MMVRSGSAITALVLGVLVPFGGFLFPPIPILALVFGIAARQEIKAGYRSGINMATTGAVLGSIAVAAYVIVIALAVGFGLPNLLG